MIRDCFVTGKWNKSQDAATLLELDDLDDAEEMDGDFEDLETGETHKGETAKPEPSSREALLEKKKKLKQQFDADYDDKDESSYHDELKMMATQQAQVILQCSPDHFTVGLPEGPFGAQMYFDLFFFFS